MAGARISDSRKMQMPPLIKPSDGPIAEEMERRLTGTTPGLGPGNAGSSPAAPASSDDVPRSSRAHWGDAPDDLGFAEARAWARGWNDALARVMQKIRGGRRKRATPPPDRLARLQAQLEAERARRQTAEKELVRVRRMLKRERRERKEHRP